MRIFVTGVDGFLGLRLSETLVAAGHQVAGLVLDRVKAQASGVLPAVELVEGDLLAFESLHRELDRLAPDLVVHLGGLSHVGQSWQEMPRYFQVNVLGTENVLRAARCPLLFASSAEVYGQVDASNLPVAESASLRPASPYALCKAAAERLVLSDRSIVVRMFNLVGPGQDPGFALPSFALQLAAIRYGNREPVLRVGNLSAQRDFVHVDDAAEALCLLVERGAQGAIGAGSEIYNLASGEATELRQALDQLIAIAGVEVRVEQEASLTRPVDVPVMCGDSSKLRGLGWAPRRGLAQALSDLWRSIVPSGL